MYDVSYINLDVWSYYKNYINQCWTITMYDVNFKIIINDNFDQWCCE